MAIGSYSRQTDLSLTVLFLLLTGCTAGGDDAATKRCGAVRAESRRDGVVGPAAPMRGAATTAADTERCFSCGRLKFGRVERGARPAWKRQCDPPLAVHRSCAIRQKFKDAT